MEILGKRELFLITIPTCESFPLKSINDQLYDDVTPLPSRLHRRHNIASALRFEYLLQPNETVALLSPNNIDYLPICLAVAMCGSKLTPLNPLCTESEVTTILDRSSSKILFTHAKLLPVALGAVAKSKTVKHIVVIPDVAKDTDLPSGSVDLQSLAGYKHAPNLTESVNEVHDHVKDVNNHPWLLPYSSGTTGLPKGVCLSHGNMIANLLQLDEVEGMVFPIVSLVFLCSAYSS
jgi:acyl-CoA synthetase (AMP-forming)/AMP-acid ligase II